MITVRSISGRPVRGSVERRELVEHAGHLVAALAAAEVDDHVGIAALGQRFEQHRLAGAEAAGDGRLAALRHREQAVEDALAGHQRRRAPARAASPAAAAHRPDVAHRQLAQASVALAQHAHGRIVGEPRRAATTDSTTPPTSGGARQRCARPVGLATAGLADHRARRQQRADARCAARSAGGPAARCACPAARTPNRCPTAAAAGRRRCCRAGRGRGGSPAAARRRAPRCPGAGRSCLRRPARRSARR